MRSEADQQLIDALHRQVQSLQDTMRSTHAWYGQRIEEMQDEMSNTKDELRHYQEALLIAADELMDTQEELEHTYDVLDEMTDLYTKAVQDNEYFEEREDRWEVGKPFKIGVDWR